MRSNFLILFGIFTEIWYTFCMKFVFGILLIALGIAIIRYRYEIHNFTGNWGWAEQYTGGTVNAIVLIGMLLVGMGTAYPLGAFDGTSLNTPRFGPSTNP